MKTLFALSTLCLCGCAVEIPLGLDGQYGRFRAEYIPPAQVVYFNILNPPMLRDK